MKEILITNDDGYEAKGLLALAKALKQLPDTNVTIVSPSNEKSACAHSITLTSPLEFIKVDEKFYKLKDGTPSDCIYLALHSLFDKKPDLIISGINHGANLGEDITYSGTCGACMEGVLQGVKSIAFSQYYKDNSLRENGFELAIEVVKKITNKVLNNELKLPEREFLNVNIPAVKKDDFLGYKFVPVGKRAYSTNALSNKNPRGVEYFWLGLAAFDHIDSEFESDISEVSKGYASITPIKLDLTSYSSLEKLKKEGI